jgi:hypothetical protein
VVRSQPGSLPAAAGKPAVPGAPTRTAGQRYALGPVSFVVPTGWHQLNKMAQDGRTHACLAPVGQPCAVNVTVLDRPGPAAEPDLPGSLGLAELSACHSTAGVPNVPPTTVASSQVTLGGVPAEYRAFATGCGAVTMRWEQWTVPTAPAFQILSHTADLRTADLIHGLVTRTARVSGRSSVRAFDYGFLVGHSGNTLLLDRAALMLVRGRERVENNSHQTRSYRISPDAYIQDHGRKLCGDGTQQSMTCSVTYLLSRLPNTVVPVRLGMDASGRIVTVVAG